MSRKTPPINPMISFSALDMHFRICHAIKRTISRHFASVEPDFDHVNDEPAAVRGLLRDRNYLFFLLLVYAESDAAPKEIRESARARRAAYSADLTAAYLAFRYFQLWKELKSDAAAVDAEDETSELTALPSDNDRSMEDETDCGKVTVQDHGLRSMAFSSREQRAAERWVRAALAYGLVERHDAPKGNGKPISATPALIDLVERIGALVYGGQFQSVLRSLGSGGEGGGDK